MPRKLSSMEACDHGIFLFLQSEKWGFPKIRGTILGVPIIGTIVFWGLYWGPLILGNYQILQSFTETGIRISRHPSLSF